MTQQNHILTDSFGRKHDYLRISLTERCNLRCFYCMPEEGIMLRDKAEFMTAEELQQIAEIYVNLGVKKIRLTGGEPLIKKNAALIIDNLSKLPVELAITTNGILVDRFVDAFKNAGITNVNVSLDSLIEDRFNAISRRNYFQKVIENVHLLVRQGFNLKINVVLMKGINDDEITDFINWTRELPIDVRFIEFMPFDGNNWNWDKKVSFQEIMSRVEAEIGNRNYVKIEDKPNDTARNFKLLDGLGTWGVISSVTNPFCDTCNRIRLTADGKIKNCLFSNDETDLLTALRNGEDLLPLIANSITKKKEKRAGIESFQKDAAIFSANRSMTTIGG